MAENTITVKSALPQQEDGGHKLAIFERNPVHEDGQLWIADDKTHEVHMTPGVMLALNEKRLVEVGKGGEAVEPTEPGAETVDGLMAHTKDDLTKLAEARGLTVAPSATKQEIAEAIVEAQ